MTINYDDIRYHIDYIEKLPTPLDRMAVDGDIWNQTVWRIDSSCGTAACLAGWKAKLDGVPAKNDKIHPSDYAREAWGLTYDQAFDLFHHANTIEDMRNLVDNWETYGPKQ